MCTGGNAHAHVAGHSTRMPVALAAMPTGEISVQVEELLRAALTSPKAQLRSELLGLVRLAVQTAKDELRAELLTELRRELGIQKGTSVKSAQRTGEHTELPTAAGRSKVTVVPLDGTPQSNTTRQPDDSIEEEAGLDSEYQVEVSCWSAPLFAGRDLGGSSAWLVILCLLNVRAAVIFRLANGMGTQFCCRL